MVIVMNDVGDGDYGDDEQWWYTLKMLMMVAVMRSHSKESQKNIPQY
jgi:hypothetical protein